MLDTLPAIAQPTFTTASGYTGTRPRKALVKVLTPKGSFSLSVQAGSGLYSEPREDGLTLDRYSEVEIALLGAPNHRGRGFRRPEEFGIRGFEDLISEYDEVGAYIPAERVVAFINHCHRANRCHVVGGSGKLGNKARKRARMARKAARLG